MLKNVDELLLCIHYVGILALVVGRLELKQSGSVPGLGPKWEKLFSHEMLNLSKMYRI